MANHSLNEHLIATEPAQLYELVACLHERESFGVVTENGWPAARFPGTSRNIPETDLWRRSSMGHPGAHAACFVDAAIGYAGYVVFSRGEDIGSGDSDTPLAQGPEPIIEALMAKCQSVVNRMPRRIPPSLPPPLEDVISKWLSGDRSGLMPRHLISTVPCRGLPDMSPLVLAASSGVPSAMADAMFVLTHGDGSGMGESFIPGCLRLWEWGAGVGPGAITGDLRQGHLYDRGNAVAACDALVSHPDFVSAVSASPASFARTSMHSPLFSAMAASDQCRPHLLFDAAMLATYASNQNARGWPPSSPIPDIMARNLVSILSSEEWAIPRIIDTFCDGGARNLARNGLLLAICRACPPHLSCGVAQSLRDFRRVSGGDLSMEIATLEANAISGASGDATARSRPPAL